MGVSVTHRTTEARIGVGDRSFKVRPAIGLGLDGVLMAEVTIQEAGVQRGLSWRVQPDELRKLAHGLLDMADEATR